MSRNKHLTKLCIKSPLHLKYVLALPWEIRSVRSSRQRNYYMYILMNHRITPNTTGSYCLKNRQTSSKSHHLYIISSKCLLLSPTQVHRRWRHSQQSLANSTFSNSVIQICPLVLAALRHTIMTSFWDRCCFLTSVRHLHG